MSKTVIVNGIRSLVREYIFTEFLSNETPELLRDSTPLISGGIIDSIGTTRLVLYLEEKFEVLIDPAEVNLGNLNSVASIVEMIKGKIENR